MNLERSILTPFKFFNGFKKAFYWARSANDNRKEKTIKKITYPKAELLSLECSNSNCSNFEFFLDPTPVIKTDL